MKKSKRVLSLVLSVIMLLGTVTVGFQSLNLTAYAAQSHTVIATTSGKGNLYQDEYSARSYPTADGKGLIVPDDDEVRILHIGDVQATAPLYEDLVHLIREGIARIKPHLIVLTGDNAMYTSTDNSFRNTIGNIVEYFYDEDGKRIPFATTFGNHDTNNNKYTETNDGASKEVQAQWYYYTKWQGGIDYDYTDVVDYGTGSLNVYAADGSTVKQKVLLMNSAVDDDRGGYGKMGYSQNSKYNDDDCYDELCTKIAADVNSANSIGAPVIAFQHIPLREMYTANGIVKSSTSTGIAAYGSINSDLVMPSSASANAGTRVTSLKFWPDTNPASKWGDEITDGYCIGVMAETICCSYSSTEKIYRILANHANTESGYTAHNNVKGIFYGHDHSNTVTGMGYIDYGSERYTLTQGYAGGMDLQHSGSDIPYISAYIVKDDVTQNLRKYTWDPTSIQEEYNVSFGAKYTVNGVPSSQTYVCDIAFGTKGTNIIKTVSTLTSESVDKAVDTLKGRGYSDANIVRVDRTVDDKPANLNYAGTTGTVGDKYIAMAYATTTDVSKAFTDIIIKTGDSSSPETITKEKYGTTITYHLVSSQDLAAGTGGDDWNYCYATTDPIAGPPITALGVTVGKDDDFGLQGGWYQECLRHYSNGKWFQDPGDCNSGCGSNTNDVVILTKTIGSPANDNKHCLDSNVTKNYDITNQYFDLAKTYKEYESKADSYKYTSESWAAFVTARENAKTLKEKIDVNRYITETKAQIDAVTEALQAAYEALEEKPVVVNDDQADSTTSDTDAPVIIAVPETIYLKASAGKATTAEYYLNNSFVNGKLTADTGSSTTGKFSISAPGADSVKITTRQYSSSFAAVSGLTMTDSSGKDLDAGTATYTPSGDNSAAAGTVGTLTLNPGLDSTTTGLLEWQFDVTYMRQDIDGDGAWEPVTLTYYAYSVLYAPHAPVAGMVKGVNVNNDRNASSTHTTWITGVQGLSTNTVSDLGDTNITTSSTKDGSMINPPPTAAYTFDYTTDSVASSIPDGSTMHYRYGKTKDNLHDDNNVYSCGKVGYIYIDSSRYTSSAKYSDIPNFKMGVDLHEQRTCKTGESAAKFGYSISTDYDKTKYVPDSTIPNAYLSTKEKVDSYATGRYEGTFSTNIDTTKTKLTAIGLICTVSRRYSGSGSKWNICVAYAYCDLYYTNKSTLRELVGNAYNSGLQEKWDTNNTFGSFKTALMQAALKLGTPTDTTNSASALTTAQTNCANGQLGNGTIHNYNYGFRRVIDAQTGTTTSYQTKAFDVTSLGKTPTGTATTANWFITKWADLSNHGYTYIGSKRASELAATVNTSNPTASALGLVNTKPQLKSEYMVSTLSNLNAYHYYLSPDYTLTIDPDGGTIGNGYTSVIGNEGSTLTATAAICTKAGYTFAGWQLVSGGGSVSGMTYTFGASNATIKALWTPNTQTVTFNPDGGIYNGNIVYLENGDATASDNFWGQGGTLTAANNGESGISINSQNISTSGNGTSNQKIRAYLEYGKSYTLSYTSTLGDGKAYFYILGTENKMVKPGSATDYSNSLIIKNRNGTVVTDNGDGTYTHTLNFTVGTGDGSNETNWNRMQTPSDATMVYYLRLDYNNTGTDHFEISNLKIVPTSDATVKIQAKTDSEIAFSNPTKEGCLFSGWTLNPTDNGLAVTGNGVEVGTSASTLTANWEVKQYLVEFDAQGHGTAPETQLIDHNGTATEPAAPTEDGYTFGGWYKEAACTNLWNFGTDTVTAATTLYAKWTLITYTISYAGEASAVSGNPATYTVETDDITLSNPAKTGYTFTGWTFTAPDTAAVTNGTAAKIAKGSSGNITATAGWRINKSSLTVDPNGLKLNGSTEQITYANKDYGATVDLSAIKVETVSDEQIFDGWQLGSGANGSFTNGTYTFGATDGATDTLTAKIINAPFVTAEQTGTTSNTVTVGYAASDTLPSAISGITARNIVSGGFTPDMTWADKVTQDIKVTNTYSGGTKDITSNVKFIPETNVLYEETAGTATNGTASWSTVSGTKGSAGSSTAKLYGYTNAYANDKVYSNGTAYEVTVGEGQTSWPTYEFTFTGTAFDINTRCDTDTGLMTVKVYPSGNHSATATLKDGKKASKAVNTIFRDGKTLYQTPTCHLEMASWGTYDVVVSVAYSKSFDPYYNKDLAGGAADEAEIEFTKKNGDVYVDLSELLGEGYEECEYEELAPISEKKKTSAIDLIDMSGSLAGGTSTANEYSVCIDSIRIYNPAGTNLTSGEIYTQYNADNELNPTYTLMKSALLTASTDKDELFGLTGDSVIYIEANALDDVPVNTKLTSLYKEKGSGNEIYLEKGNGIGFTIDKSKLGAMHIALRSPTGEPVTAVVGTGDGAKTITINTATEMYYDVLDCLDTDGTLAIAVDAGSTGMLAIGECKTVGSGSSSPTPHASPAALAKAAELVEAVSETSLEGEETLTFTVNFGDAGVATVTYSEDRFEYVLRDGQWALTVNFTEEEIEELFADAGLADDYTLGKIADTALVAELVDGEWVTRDVTFGVEEADAPGAAAEQVLTIFDWLIEIMKLIRELFDMSFAKVVIL